MALPTLLGLIPERLWIMVSIASVAIILFLGMGLGCRLVITKDGIGITMIFLGVPYKREQYPLSANVGLEKYKNGRPSGVFIVDPGANHECVVGSARTADWLLA